MSRKLNKYKTLQIHEHFKQRLKERYRINLTDEIYQDFLEQVQQNTAIFIEKKKSNTLWFVDYEGKKVKVVYDPYFEKFVTALPKRKTSKMQELTKQKKAIEAEFFELRYKLSEKPLSDLVKIHTKYVEIIKEHGKNSHHLIQFWRRNELKQQRLTSLVKWQDKHFKTAYKQFCELRDKLAAIDEAIEAKQK